MTEQDVPGFGQCHSWRMGNRRSLVRTLLLSLVLLTSSFGYTNAIRWKSVFTSECVTDAHCVGIRNSVCIRDYQFCEHGSCYCKEGDELISYLSSNSQLVGHWYKCAPVRYLGQKCTPRPENVSFLDDTTETFCYGKSRCEPVPVATGVSHGDNSSAVMRAELSPAAIHVCMCPPQWRTSGDGMHCVRPGLRELNQPCTSDQQCFGDNIVYMPQRRRLGLRCYRGHCQCLAGYEILPGSSRSSTPSLHSCWQKTIGSRCHDHADCANFGGECANHRCHCPSNTKLTEYRYHNYVVKACMHAQAKTELQLMEFCNSKALFSALSSSRFCAKQYECVYCEEWNVGYRCSDINAPPDHASKGLSVAATSSPYRWLGLLLTATTCGPLTAP